MSHNLAMHLAWRPMWSMMKHPQYSTEVAILSVIQVGTVNTVLALPLQGVVSPIGVSVEFLGKHAPRQGSRCWSSGHGQVLS